ncbi:dihydropteroate synthase [Parapedobacter defluvii]|uniref:Dihydropteroate synthase n=1 Tax=Parapedobacter defluvii TaxID=2045106 RepID=A0ABQ1LH18_9SPHI|nr:dihydropteroate synthase [Parapedobacter defluvii]GGC23098.1 dihydropteroate synthase [Parapedobacter defluvii]
MNAQGRLIDLTSPKVMGIMNVTPDSFFDGGRHNTIDAALRHAEKLLDEGADLLDIGAYSSRPGAANVSIDEEVSRLLPVIDAITTRFPEAVLSIDTFRADVARAAIEAGAHVINDISGGTLDEQMFATVAELQVPYILMHMRGTPDTMQQLTDYTDLVEEVNLFFGKQIAALRRLGVKDLILDPGFGFAKTLQQNYDLLNRLEELHIHGLPILGAISRKSMIYKKLGITPAEALNGTTALHALLLAKGVQILRVHDVKAAKEVITLLK